MLSRSSLPSGALYTYLGVEYESKCPDTQVADITSLIGSKLRGGFTVDYEDFKNVRTHMRARRKESKLAGESRGGMEQRSLMRVRAVHHGLSLSLSLSLSL